MFSQYGELWPIRAEIGLPVWGAPTNFTGFRVLTSLLHWRRSSAVNHTLHDVCPSPGLVHYTYIFWGSCPLTEFYQVQNSLSVQVLHSPIFAALLHGTRGSVFTRWGSQKLWVFCLSVCPSCFRMSEIVGPTSPSRRWSTEAILIPLDRGRFVVVHPCSAFSDCSQLSTPQNAEVQKVEKFGGFSPPESDRINWSRRNLARKHRLRVCSSTPNLALIVKGAGYISPKMSKFGQNYGFFVHGRWHNKQIRM